MDFAIGDFTITRGRATVVDFMTSFYGETKTFIIRTPKEDKMMIYTNVFKVCLSSFQKVVYIQVYYRIAVNLSWPKNCNLAISLTQKEAWYLIISTVGAAWVAIKLLDHFSLNGTQYLNKTDKPNAIIMSFMDVLGYMINQGKTY